MDEKTRMENYTAEDIVETINEVRAARGEYGSLEERLAALEALLDQQKEVE